MLGVGEVGAGLFGHLFDGVDFALGVVGKAVEHDHGIDAGLLEGTDMVGQVGLGALLDQLDVLGGIGGVELPAGDDLGSAAVHLEGAGGGDQDRAVGLQSREAAF